MLKSTYRYATAFPVVVFAGSPTDMSQRHSVILTKQRLPSQRVSVFQTQVGCHMY